MVVALVLPGCATETQFATGLEAAKGSPALREELVVKCVKENKLVGEQRRLIAKTMNVSESGNVERTLCSRLLNGFASGRITYADYQKTLYQGLTPKFIRVIQER